MRVVRAPHQGLNTDILVELGADRVELERRLALAAPILARLHLHQIAEAVPVLEIHAIERIWQPAEAAFAERNPPPRMTFEDPGAYPRAVDVDEPHRDRGPASEHRHPPALAGNAFARPRRSRRE